MYCVMGWAASPRIVAPLAPLFDRLAVGGGPALPGGGAVQHLVRARVDALEVRQHLFLAAFAHAPLFLFAAVEGHHQVVLLAAAQRVVHQVAVGAGPQHRRVDAQFLGHVVALDHGAVDHVAGHARRIADQVLADHRLDAVGADHRVGLVAVAFGVGDFDAFFVLFDAGDLGRGAKADQRVLLHRFQDGQMDVGAVDHGVGAAETLAEGGAGVDAHHFARVDRVHHDDVVGEDRALARRGAHAQRIERGEGVGAELDAGADLADVRGLLQQLHRDALARQRQRRGQAADAAAHDDDGLGRVLCGGCVHCVVPCVFIPGGRGRRLAVAVAPAAPPRARRQARCRRAAPWRPRCRRPRP